MAEATYSPNTNQNNSNLGGSVSSRNGYFAYVVASSFSDKNLPFGAVKLKAIGKSSGNTSTTAFPFYQFLKTLPIVGEVVYVIAGPSPGDQLRGAPKDYYLASLNLWNHPQAGITSVANQVKSPDPEWRETPDTNPLKPFPGDIIVEGRKGQSIRLSESLSQTPWQGSRPDLSTVAIVSGINTTGNPTTYVVEDINKDASSIYLLQGQSIPLEAPYQWKRKEGTSYGLNVLPRDAKSYKGNQVVINSGRIYLNAKTEHVLISAQEYIGLLGNQVHIDAITNINLAAPTLNLTSGALDPTFRNSAVKGEGLLLELENMYMLLAGLCSDLSNLVNAQDAPCDSAEVLLSFLNERVDNNAQKLKEALLSKNVFLS